MHLRQPQFLILSSGSVFRGHFTEEWFRYYTQTQGSGFKYGLKLMLQAQGVAAARTAGVNLDTASDAALGPYARYAFEYNDEGRVTKESVRGGTAEHLFTWLTRSTDPGFAAANEWYRQCTETLPDGSKRIVYTSRAGRTLVDITEEAGANPGRWIRFHQYDTKSRRILSATPAAVASVSEPGGAGGTLSVTLKTDAGKINLINRYPATDIQAGEVEGYIQSKGVKVGSQGTEEIQRKFTYDTHTVGNVSLHPVREQWEYAVAGQPDQDAAKTTWDRTWHKNGLGSDTLQVEEITETLPLVSEQEHGSGELETVVQRFDSSGDLIWVKDARGIITRNFWDKAVGGIIRRIDDADTGQLQDVPLGWNTPDFGGAHLVTDFELDDQGRQIREIGPVHEALEDQSAVEPHQAADIDAVELRSVTYTLHLDTRHQTWQAQGYVVGYGAPGERWSVLGPVKIEQRDAQERVVDNIQCRPQAPSGPLSTNTLGSLDPLTHLPGRALWTRWSRILRDLWGRRTAQRDYTDIPEEGEGFEGDNYRLSEFAYDSRSRLTREVSPDKTIAITLRDVRNLITSVWVGTDDSGATEADPGNGGAGGNNMKPVNLKVYDDGQDGGNGNLTSDRYPVNDNLADDRVTERSYDGRDRLVGLDRSDGTRQLLRRFEYDNLDQRTATTRYHTAVDDANRIGREEISYDPRKRRYQKKRYGADPATGNLVGPLVEGLWHDGDSNVIRQDEAGSGKCLKTQFDGLNRTVASFQVVAGTPPQGAPANDVSDDIVVEQDEFVWNGAGNVVLTIHRQRLHDATGTGPLSDPAGAQPRARRSYVATWQDGIGRSRFRADYGTNGGAELVRPALPPARSLTILVEETRYAADGQPGCEIGPDGAISRTARDSLGEPLLAIEALGTAAERTVRFRWHASAKLDRLLLENPDTGEQVTQWLYGTSLDTSGVARNDLVASKIYPTGESDTMSYNRQSDLASLADANGSTREFAYDKLARLIQDAATTLGPEVDGTMRRITLEYDDRGLLGTVSTWDDPAAGQGNVLNQVGLEYDAFEELVTDLQEHDGAIDGNTPAVSYGNTDGSGNTLRRTSATTPSGAKILFGYGSGGSIDEAFNRVASLQVDGENDHLVDYAYAGVGRVVTLAYPAPGAELSYLKPVGTQGQGDAGDDMTGYDRFGRTERMPWRKTGDGSVLAEFAYGYDEASRRQWRQDLTPAAEEAFDRYHGYDPLGQVTRSDRGTLNENRSAIGGIPEEAEAWGYDEQGNWLTFAKDVEGSNVIDQERTHNKSNQIVTIDGSGSGVDFDLNGNMTRVPTGADLAGPARKLVWNAWNQLVEVRDDADELTQRNAYDGLFRRTTRELGDSTLIHSYYNDQWRPVEERKGSSADPSAIWYWGARHRDDLARRDRDSNDNGTLDESLWCFMDYFDPVAVIDGSGAVQERYAYSAFGAASVLAPDYSARLSSSFGWEFLFHGQFQDEETGWQNYGYRFYLPELGRWLSRDPIGESGGLNLYQFAINDPNNYLDWLGLQNIELPRWDDDVPEDERGPSSGLFPCPDPDEEQPEEPDPEPDPSKPAKPTPPRPVRPIPPSAPDSGPPAVDPPAVDPPAQDRPAQDRPAQDRPAQPPSAD